MKNKGRPNVAAVMNPPRIDPVKRYGGRFATAISCMDGRIQLPIINFLKEQFDVKFIDIITEPGPIKYLAQHKNHSVLETIRKRLHISVDIHGSSVIAVSGHHDCAGNPVQKKAQLNQIEKSVSEIRSWGFKKQKIIKLWIDEHWRANVIK